MPILTFNDGSVRGEAIVVCRSCLAQLTMSLTTDGAPDQSVRERLLVRLYAALRDVAEEFGWTNIDEHHRGTCPHHPRP